MVSALGVRLSHNSSFLPVSSQPAALPPHVPHSRWVKGTHWIVTLSFLLLVFTGFEILMVHPRLYWGETGNDLTPALVELPISRNYRHGGWQKQVSLSSDRRESVSAVRTFDIFNQNGWGRSLHFLAGGVWSVLA